MRWTANFDFSEETEHLTPLRRIKHSDVWCTPVVLRDYDRGWNTMNAYDSHSLSPTVVSVENGEMRSVNWLFFWRESSIESILNDITYLTSSMFNSISSLLVFVFPELALQGRQLLRWNNSLGSTSSLWWSPKREKKRKKRLLWTEKQSSSHESRRV